MVVFPKLKDDATLEDVIKAFNFFSSELQDNLNDLYNALNYI